MAFLELHCYSRALVHQVEIHVLLPQRRPWQPPLEGPRRTLYLLHGMGDDHTSWMRQTALERYIEGMNLTVVIPGAMHGAWTDIAEEGPKVWEFVSEELPELMESLLGIRPDRETTYAAGMSMGGYGALKLGFRCPERFKAVASMSAAPISRAMARAQVKQQENPEIMAIIRHAFGEDIRLEDDIFQLAKNCAGPKPAVYLACGAEDHFYPLNQGLLEHLDALGYQTVWRENPGQAHTWGYWDMCLPEMLAWVMEK